MKIDALVAEIGSTTTVVSGFDRLRDNPVFLGQGFSATTVTEGDVTLGLDAAIDNFRKNLGVESIEADKTYATSSAAGGLKMSVHGLVYDMTVKAAREAALGAGANLKLITAGVLNHQELSQITDLKLNIIMIAGGVDYGDTVTALENAQKIASLQLGIPVIYAGNIQNQDAIKKIFADFNQTPFLTIIDNVYPKIDVLHTDEARKVIQSVFEQHITKAPGMEKVRSRIQGTIMPTPGAVMEATLLLQQAIGDLCTIDIGGATTDIHSVTHGNKKNEKMMINPEPFAKRTVEGDLGVYINKDHIVDTIGKNQLSQELNITKDTLDNLLTEYLPIPPKTHFPLVKRLALEAMQISLERHAGRYIHLYGASGKTTLVEGRDLTGVKHVIGTGGALTRIPGGTELIRQALLVKKDWLLKPPFDANVLIDNDYIMACMGVLSTDYPEAAIILMRKSLGIG